MFKLYRREPDKSLLYREAWFAGDHVVEHWGVGGDRGQTRDHPAKSEREGKRVLTELKKRAQAEGYESIPPSRMAMLVVEYPVEGGFGALGDLQRRHRIEDQLNELIGWVGLGHLDGGSIGSGTMEVALLVVDFELAKRAIEAAIGGTEADGFSRIY